MSSANHSFALENGEKVGRYVILKPIGAGGMGAVYAAYDPELDRRIALKFILPDKASGADAASARARLVREARSMAHVSHPAILPIHDVGTLGDQVFIAIELIDGGTIREWIAEEARSWRDVLGAYIQAGKGLEAAHGQNLVHRDFKPDNVLIDKDGWVRVTDFGLAGHSGQEEASTDNTVPAALARRRSTWDPGKLTVTGEMLGTPGYSSVEQLTGGALDERADQFSFCAALYEGLYGDRPYKGDSIFDLIVAIEEGNIEPAPANSDVPEWIRNILVRGLSPEAGARYASMHALLEELSNESAARLGRMWNAARKREIAAAFAGTELPFAADSWEAATKVIDTYAHDWVQMYRDTWAATHERGEQSAGLLDLRMLFLEQRGQELSALLDQFARATDDVVQRAVQAARALTAVAGCADVAMLRSMVRPPDNAKDRKKVEAIDASLAEARALNSTGQYDSALRVAQTAAQLCDTLDYFPVKARALHVIGLLMIRTGDSKGAHKTLIEAVAAADAGRDDRERAAAAVQLVFVVGYQMGDLDAGRHWCQMTEAVLARIGDDSTIRATLLSNQASLYWLEGRYAEALDCNTRALELRTESLGADHPSVADSLNNLGGVALRTGDAEQAIKHYERALDIYERSLGPAHPRLGAALTNLGTVCTAGGDHAKALEYYERALAIQENALGQHHPRLSATLKNIGVAHLAMRQAERAAPPLERSLEIYEKQTDLAHSIKVAAVRFNLAQALQQSGDRPRAVRLASQSRDDYAAAGDEHAKTREKIEAWLRRARP